MTRPRGRRLSVFVVTLVDPHGDMKIRAFRRRQDAATCAGAWIGAPPPYSSESEFMGVGRHEDFSAYVEEVVVE